MSALLESESSAVTIEQEREILSAVCIYPHVSSTTGPRAPTDYVIPAILMTCSQCERPALPELKCFFLFCALLLANDRWLGLLSRTINLANHMNRESVLRLFAEVELSLGGLQCV